MRRSGRLVVRDSDLRVAVAGSAAEGASAAVRRERDRAADRADRRADPVDERKVETFEAFQKATADNAEVEAGPGGRRTLSLRAFADQRRAYLLKTTDTAKADAGAGAKE